MPDANQGRRLGRSPCPSAFYSANPVVLFIYVCVCVGGRVVSFGRNDMHSRRDCDNQYPGASSLMNTDHEKAPQGGPCASNCVRELETDGQRKLDSAEIGDSESSQTGELNGETACACMISGWIGGPFGGLFARCVFSGN